MFFFYLAKHTNSHVEKSEVYASQPIARAPKGSTHTAPALQSECGERSSYNTKHSQLAWSPFHHMQGELGQRCPHRTKQEQSNKETEKKKAVNRQLIRIFTLLLDLPIGKYLAKRVLSPARYVG